MIPAISLQAAADHVAALDDIRATCEHAGIRGEDDVDDPASPGPAPVRTRWSTAVMVAELAGKLVEARDDAHGARRALADATTDNDALAGELRAIRDLLDDHGIDPDGELDDHEAVRQLVERLVGERDAARRSPPAAPVSRRVPRLTILDARGRSLVEIDGTASVDLSAYGTGRGPTHVVVDLVEMEVERG